MKGSLPSQRLEELFHHAVGLTDDERDRYLERACDPELLDELRALLAAASADDPTPPPVAASLRALLAAPALDGADIRRQIGPYRLIRPLGRGGMSTVYLAVREDGRLRRRVALKLLSHHADDETSRRRFERERQLLAGLDHPHIARLLDGGSTRDGRPYVVMETVDGLPIDRYCASRSLPVSSRLQLVATVCRAVHHAHRNLVIHRDIKPSNILVTQAGEPKLLDFGIARLVNEDLLSPELDATRPLLEPMTAAYASPEQLRGERLGTATDVYSLGVLLFELLVGRRPYILEGLPLLEVARTVGETPAPAPSTVAADRRLASRLKGDLDAIVLQALHKEPGRRYASAERLAEDLERHLVGRPVSARPSTVVYRLAKTARRHRAASALTLLLVTGGVGLAVQTVRLRTALAESHERRLEARRAERRSAEVTHFLLELFEASDPSQNGGRDSTARELLARGARTVERGLSGQPRLQATMLDTLGQVHTKLGDYVDAERLLETGLAIRRRTFGDLHAAVAESLAHLAFLRHLRGELEAAESLGREALAIHRRLFGPRDLRVATSLHNLAETLAVRGRSAEAEQGFREALAMRLDDPDADPREVAESQAELGVLLADLGRTAEAEPLLQRALATWRRLGPEHPQVAFGLECLAYSGLRRGAGEAAEELYRQALALRRRVQGEEHPSTADPLWGIGRALLLQGRLEEAERPLRHALALLRATNPGDPMIGTILADLGDASFYGGELAAAAAFFEGALATFDRTLGASHEAAAMTLRSLARVQRRRGELAAAATHFVDLLALRREQQPPLEGEIGMTLFELGRVLVEQRRFERAEPLLREARRRLRAAGEMEWAAVAGGELGTSLAGQGRTSEARDLLLESRERLARAGDTWASRSALLAQRLAALDPPPSLPSHGGARQR